MGIACAVTRWRPAVGLLRTRDPTTIFRAVSLETICQLVAAGFGCTLLPALAARAAQGPEPRFVIQPLQSRNASRRIGLVWRRGYPKVQELGLLAKLIRDNPPDGTRTVPMETSTARREVFPN